MAHEADRPRVDAPAGFRMPGARLVTGRSGAWLFTLALVAAAVAMFVLRIAPIPTYDAEDQIPWPVFAVAFAVAEVAVVHLLVRNQAVSISLSEIPLVIGFYFVAPAYLLVAQLVGSGVALVVYRRQPPLKLVFNLAMFSLAGGMAILVFRTIAALDPSSLFVWWLASFAGIATSVVVSAVAISAVISLSQRRLELAALRMGLLFGLFNALVNTSIALVGVVFLSTQPDDLWLLAAPALVGLLGYRAFSAQRQRQARLAFLYDCSEILARPLLDETVVVRLLARTRAEFRAAAVEVVLADESGDGTVARIAVDRDDRPTAEVVGLDVLDDRRTKLGTGGEGRRVARGSAPSRALLAEDPDEMIVPLHGTGEAIGTLLVAGHLDDLAGFDEDDLRLLALVGSRLGLIAENTGLIERLAASLTAASQLAAIVQSSEDAMVAIDLEGRIAAWNPSAELLFGHPSDTMVGRPASEILTEAERAPFREMFAKVESGSVVRDVQMEWTRADGVEVPVSVTMSPIRAPEGSITGVSAIIRDETSRRKAETSVAASTELFRIVIDGSPIGMGVAGVDNLWMRANPALGAMLGRTADETIGRSALEMIHPDDRDTIADVEGRIFEGDTVLVSVERRYVDREGRVVLAQVIARRLVDPSSGRPVALYSIENITDQRRAEEQARSTEERFRQAALAISATQDPNKVLPVVLTSARDVLHAEYGAIATYAADGSAISSIEFDGLDADEIVERVGRWPRGVGILGLASGLGRPIRIRDVATHPAFGELPPGHPLITSFLAVPIPHHGPGGVTLFLANKTDGDEFTEVDETIAAALATHAAVCLDNTRINGRALELVEELDRANLELVKANEAKSQFLASVAHELRTPLHAILIAGELIHDPPSGPLGDAETRSLGLTIESSGRHMVSLIDDLVDLSRIEAGRLDIRPTDVTLGTVLGEIGSSLAHLAQSRRIVLDLPLDPGPSVFADPVRLRQILSNLVANALKFTDSGGRVWVDYGSTRDATSINVHDTGIGIAAEDLERAFLPFEQVSRTSTPGAGLGLAISRSLAELHGGELSARSEPGVGSVFTLTLPKSTRATRRRPSASDAVPAVPAGDGRAILVVEDNATARGLAANVLGMAGYDVWQASGLGEALVILDEATPELVLLDVRLGDGNGLELAERLRSDGAHENLPILVLSADAMPDDVRRAKKAGCNDFLSKPVSPRTLLARISALIGTAERGP